MRHRVARSLVTALLILASVAADGRAQADGALSGPLAPSASLPSFTPTLRSEISTEAVARLNADLRRSTRPTYWLTGGLIGGVAMGVLGAVVGAGLCADDDTDHSTGTCILAGLGGAAIFGGVGFTVGALIGGLFPKSEAAPSGS
jgi:hypothetical protein